ncbi:hypothetical protein DFH09DRAFT_1290174 [Mycena vulgaris]|nr:hypothetical protein DFH09DRAFT_1290174 [Mycena vulgaris]
MCFQVGSDVSAVLLTVPYNLSNTLWHQLDSRKTIGRSEGRRTRKPIEIFRMPILVFWIITDAMLGHAQEFCIVFWSLPAGQGWNAVRHPIRMVFGIASGAVCKDQIRLNPLKAAIEQADSYHFPPSTQTMEASCGRAEHADHRTLTVHIPLQVRNQAKCLDLHAQDGKPAGEAVIYCDTILSIFPPGWGAISHLTNNLWLVWPCLICAQFVPQDRIDPATFKHGAGTHQKRQRELHDLQWQQTRAAQEDYVKRRTMKKGMVGGEMEEKAAASTASML